MGRGKEDLSLTAGYPSLWVRLLNFWLALVFMHGWQGHQVLGASLVSLQERAIRLWVTILRGKNVSTNRHPNTCMYTTMIVVVENFNN